MERIFLNENIQILADITLLEEISEVAYREKFRKYITIEDADEFISSLKRRLKPVVVTSVIDASPDPEDNFILALARDGKAEYIVTGDKRGLLELGSFEEIPIVRLQAFLDILTLP
ncbi:putative PIN family toxin of toxin-antitoxin system [Dyadobacter sp. BE34]|uniref:PIN family toxin of toxin-antitoxin system n=1 Tax=Dyadobacter fermentans TaxID=94254 RepID=A0ABU1R5W1_9BACT|nr:putative PIN family toxin of toxin-antitoxin system [Dyadobacter fermentans]MDR7045696.1 putative PIN family toxin of toxin-antitoxin system [Dyadobacter sp. BE242]MDR7200009.1 putative PIN family toxin of toxin-antitoxin system [Dyadobacter sp. BE34]MDR7217532.1 putative PIN family toxin of toxin-antitoxin system [Dyadobacter sp. BE31]MDR7265900.1 putative PIN family toxin of toxin-antitoxin system [Dyadobacter sp. BE32]